MLSMIRAGIFYEDEEDVYFIRSSKYEAKRYKVMRQKDDAHWVCECPDHHYRNRDCKHIKRVRMVDQLRREDRL